ncbi:patatin-like phospholipase family protein [Mesorhizobium australicum]|uniref:patatin-like phospholipase family protein n=1 Tax=Mesorhizobium australicum TaxID=536018 RepID=UPI00333CF3C7
MDNITIRCFPCSLSAKKIGEPEVASHVRRQNSRRKTFSMIFKASEKQAHGRRKTFDPGFGCTLADAVQASCSAYPFFKLKVITTSRGEIRKVGDGGYCANNPALYAIADAVEAYQVPRTSIRLLSIGVGEYPPPKNPCGASCDG